MNQSTSIKVVSCLALLACIWQSPLNAAEVSSEPDSTNINTTASTNTAASDSTTSGGAARTVAQAQTTASTKKAKKSFSIGQLPVYLAGIATGAAVGMPVSLVRRSIWEEKQGIQGLCGDSKNKLAIISAGAFWLPFSAFLGAAEAPVMGPVNSLKNYDKPFSKDQFSLGALGDGGGRGPE
jgi:hypothetical protein